MELIEHEYERGCKDGAVDIANGSPTLFWQTRGVWGDFLTQRMAEQFGICVEHTSDLTTAAQISYRAGYNEAVKSQVEKQFGNGSFQAVLTEVERFREELYRQHFGHPKS
jgi:hypothetical protein